MSPTTAGQGVAHREQMTPKMAQQLEQLSIDTVRTLAMDAVEAAKSGHPGTPMALAPLAYALWTQVMTYDPARPAWPDRDRFVLSAGHASMLLYAMLHLTGYEVSLDDLRRFRQWGSRTAGHPEHGHLAGVETTTGPLGQGFANAVGMALAERMLAARFNRQGHEVVDHRTWVIASDGDLMEGISHEAASLAGHLSLGKLCVFYDDNRITIDGRTDLSFSEDVPQRFRACGWNVLELPLGAGPSDYAAAAEAARASDRPTLVACRTVIAEGAPTKADTSAAHGAPLGEAEVRATKRAIGWPEDASFLVPPEVRAHLLERGRRGAAAADAWERRMDGYRHACPEESRALDRVLSGRLPDAWEAAVPAAGSFAAGTKAATRKTSGEVINRLAAAIPELVGGSADLAESNNTDIKGGGSVRSGEFGGRNLHFGIREHAMGGLLNGMALHGGLRPFGGTFLVFSDYMRPAIRLAALMRLPVVYVFTHDSIGLGEDGPTHQPVEHLAALRAIPGLTVIRPADAPEVAEAWRAALRSEGPVALILTRQAVPVLERTAGPGAAAGLHRGAYVLQEPPVPPRASILATGSEVEVAVAAAARLAREGVPVRVVSFPCWSAFERVPVAEQEDVLGRGIPRVAVEAASSFGWHRWLGPRGATVTLDRFGASAPGARVLAELGFTDENVASAVRRVLADA
jgi:transketolase